MPTTPVSPHQALQAALRPAFPVDARRLAVLAALVLAIIQARTVVLYSLKNIVALPGNREARYLRLLRFVRFTFPERFCTPWVLGLLPPGELWLILDRTNWKLGKKDVNIPLLSATWRSISLPLLWTLLPHGGSSAQTDRIALMNRFLSLCGERRVAGLLADREFAGKAWFKFLKEKRIRPCIRLKSDAKVNGIAVRACFCKLQVGEVRSWYRPMTLYGVRLRVLATKNAFGEVLYLAYQGHAKQNLARYASRWQAECLHGALKSRGFNLEDTGLTTEARVSTLLLAVSMAFVWACLTGEMQASKVAVEIKKHGYAAVSVFRLGLDVLQDALRWSSLASWSGVIVLLTRLDL